MLASDLASDLASALDPVCFARRCVTFELDDWQKRVLRSTGNRMLLLLCHRQSGKSTACGLLALWTAVYQPKSLILLLAPAERQSGELYRKIIGFCEHAGVVADTETMQRMEFANGSRIIVLPGSAETVRGYSSASLLLLDEAALCPDRLLTAVLPMVARSQGRVIGLSTPAGRRGWFFNMWEYGDWEKIAVPIRDNPRITPEAMALQRSVLTAFDFQQEWDCLFLDDDQAVFSEGDIKAALETTSTPVNLKGDWK